MADNIRQFVEFKIGQEEYGVDILQVKTIERMMPITRVPKAPKFVEGVINLRGNSSRYRFKKRFDLPSGETTENTRIIIVSVDEITVGMIVDSATEVVQLAQDAIEPAPPITSSIDSDYLDGVGKIDGKLLVLLNVAKLLKPQEINQLTQI